MGNNKWCVIKSHPIVRQIAEKYNITKEDARAVYNKARKEDRSLMNDDIPFNEVIENEAFKEAIKDYTDKFVEYPSFLTKSPGYGTKERVTYSDVIREELGMSMTNEEVEERMDMLKDLNTTSRVNNITSDKLARVLTGFKSSSRLNFVGQWMTSFFIETVTALDTSVEARESYGVKQQSLRTRYFTDPDVREKIKNQIYNILILKIDALEQEGNSELAGELQTAADEIDTILYMYGGNFYDEGIQVAPEGGMTAKGQKSKEEEAEFDDENEENNDDEGELPVNSFSASDQNASVFTKIVPSIKQLLATLRDVNDEGVDKEDQYGYHLWAYMPVRESINKILNWCQGKDTYADIIATLKNNVNGNPWVQTLIDILDTEKATDAVGGDASISRKEQLHTMFLQSMRKQLTVFRQTYLAYNTLGYPVSISRDVNVKHLYTSLHSKLRRSFNKKKGMSIYKNGKLNFQEIYALRDKLALVTTTNSTFNDKLLAAKQIALDLASIGTRENGIQDFASAFRKLEEAKKSIIDIMKNLGIKLDKNQLNDFLNNNPEAEFVDSRFWGNDEKFGNSSFATQYTRLERLRQLCLNIINEYSHWDNWMRLAAVKKIDVKDSLETNPLSMSKDASDYMDLKKIRWAYDLLFKQLSRFAADSYEQNARIESKDYYAMNNPSTVQTIVEKLSNMNLEERKKYILKRYANDTVWFLRPDSTQEKPHFYCDLLERLYYGEDEGVLAYSEKPSVYGTTYDQVSDRLYNLAMLNDFFQGAEGQENWAWYRMFISSDKPRYSMLRDRKYTKQSQSKFGNTVIEEDFRTEVTNRAVQFFAQELRRAIDVVNHGLKENVTRINDYDINPDKPEIKAVLDKIKSGQTVTHKDVVKNGEYIFKNTGASFFFSKFLNESIENNTKLGKYVVDRIFNSAKYSGKQLTTPNAIKLYRDEFAEYMNRTRKEYYQYLDKIGMLRVKFKKTVAENDDGTREEAYLPHAEYIAGEIQNWHAGDDTFNMYTPDEDELAAFAEEMVIDIVSSPENRLYACELMQFYKDLEVYTYNFWLARANSMEVINVDPAFYKNTVNAQKRAAQQISSGFVTDPDAMIHGKLVSDGKYRSITIQTEFMTSEEISHIKDALISSLSGIKDARARKRMEENINDTIDKLTKMDTTDGQGVVGLSSLRKRLAGQGEWSRSNDEKIDDDGYYESDGKKHYVYTDEAVYRRMRRGYKTEIDKGAKLYDLQHVFAQPQKDFVYAFVNSEREGRGMMTTAVQHKNSEAALIFLSAFIEGSKLNTKMEGLAKFLEYTVTHNDNHDERQGIDTINWDSCVKIGGNNRVIDLSECKTGQEVFEALKAAVYEDGTDNYKKDGTVTEYDNQEYKIVQQNPEHFKDNSQPLGSQIKVHSISNINDNDTFTLSDGTKISGKELKRRYFSALKRKTEDSEKKLRRDMGLDVPYSRRVDKLSAMFRKAMQIDDRFTSEMRRNLGIIERDEKKQFVIPLDDTAQQLSVEATLMSHFRKAYYKAKTNGGIVVQATSWDASEDLHIRFKSKDEDDIRNNDGLLMTLSEFKNKNKNKNWSEEQAKDRYEEYRKKNQGEYAYFEFEVTMPDYIKDMLKGPDGEVEAKYFNDDGSWNMDEIKKVVPESAFEAICYRIPTEAKYSIMVCKLKRFAREGGGSVARYPIEITTFTGSDFDIDKDFIELRPIPGSKMEDTDNEIFEMQMAVLRSSSGQLESFRSGDFSDVSELSYYVHLLESGYTRKELDGLTPKQLKTLCEREEDLDFMSPTTDGILRRQNMESKDMIAVAAVGTVSHSFLSIYNEDNGTNIPSENNVRIKLHKGTSKADSECFVIVNDKNGKEINSVAFGTQNGYVILDPTYDMDGNLISAEIGKYVGASADAAKDAALYRLNITMETLPVLQFLHRIGVSSEVARLFIANPAIRDITLAMGGNSISGYNTVSGVIRDLISMIPIKFDNVSYEQASARYNEIAKRDTNELRYSKLLWAIEDPESISLDDYLTCLHLYEKFSHMADLLRNFDSFARYNSTNAMRGSSFIDRYAKRQSIVKLKTMLNAEEPRFSLPKNVDILPEFEDSEYGRMCSMFPYVASIIHGEEEMLDNVIIENMHTYGPTFFRAVNELEIEEDPASMKLLYGGWKNYLLFVSGNRIVDFWNPSTVRYYTRDFARHYFNIIESLEGSDPEFYQKVIENNTFLDSISVIKSKDGYTEFEVLSADARGKKGPDLELYQRDWEKLLDYPQTRKLATDIAIYFMARSAAFSSDTPVMVMPAKIKEAIPNYIKAHTDADKINVDDDEFQRFITMFLRNNADNRKIVPTIFNSKNKHVIEFDERKGKIKLNPDFINGYSKYLKTEGEKGMFLKLPVLSMIDGGNPQLYIVSTTNPLLEEKDGDETWLTIEAMPASTLGIPNQMVEYTGLDTTSSIFGKYLDADENVIYAENEADIPIIEEANIRIDNTPGFLAGRRVGTFIKSSPFGDDGTYADIASSSLSRDVNDFTNNPYLESRIHLRRAKQIMNFLGIKLGGITRGNTSSGPSYMFNVVPTGNILSDHERTIEAAALISSLGFETDSTPRVKTYISDPMSDDFNGIETSIKMGSDETTRRAIQKTLKEQGNWRYEIDGNAGEVRLSYSTGKVSDKEELLRYAGKLCGATKSLIQKVTEAGGTIASEAEFNYIKEESVDKTEVLTKLKNYAAEAERLSGDTSRKNKEALRERGIETRQEVRLNDIVDLAIRREKGEKINQDIRALFNEQRLPLRNTSVSITSSQIAAATMEEIGSKPNLFAELVAIARLTPGQDSEQQIINNVIVNTANWIIGNRPVDTYYQLAESVGMSRRNSEDIMTTIKGILEKLNIC